MTGRRRTTSPVRCRNCGKTAPARPANPALDLSCTAVWSGVHTWVPAPRRYTVTDVLTGATATGTGEELPALLAPWYPDAPSEVGGVLLDLGRALTAGEPTDIQQAQLIVTIAPATDTAQEG